MDITASFNDDVRTAGKGNGGYEWWYFDAVSDDGTVQFVIIFYEGNPFSRRYISRQQNGTEAPAEDYPAISISVYKHRQPFYYSFTEVDKSNVSFRNDQPFATIEDHTMSGRIEDKSSIYELQLNETLPSGDSIKAELRFEAPLINENLFGASASQNKNHRWNLIQPGARVTGIIRCKARNESPEEIYFKGTGYHDHNSGSEPLKQQFTEWYWGRFHFGDSTLIYYAAADQQEEYCGWLIDRNNKKIQSVFKEIYFEDKANNLYGISSARRLKLVGKSAEAMIQQTHILDNGPFYQRFSSDAFLHAASEKMRSAAGISEYLCPPRIYNRLYWPLTNMRIRYRKEPPHWVQRSKTFYRWTW